MLNENLIFHISQTLFFCCSLFFNGSNGSNLDSFLNAEVKPSYGFSAASQIGYSYKGES